MRMSFSQIIQACKDIAIDDQSVSYTGMSDSLTFIKREINNTVNSIFSLIKEYKLQPGPRTASTVASQTYYSYPPDFSKLESITVNIGSNSPRLTIVQSQEEWDRLIQISLTGFPTHVFPRQLDFGLYPTPGAVYTMTLNGNYNPVNMTNVDYIDGTVTTTLNSATVTGASTTFTAAMVNRWFAITSGGIAQGNWYKVSTYTSVTSIAITPTFAEATGATQNYIIGESPDIPPELHEYIPYRVGSVYWHTRRHDSNRAQELANYFFTGDFNNTKRSGRMTGGVLSVLNDLRNNGRGNSNLIETGGNNYNNDYLTNTIWGTTLSTI